MSTLAANSDDAAVLLVSITLNRVTEGNVTQRVENHLDLRAAGARDVRLPASSVEPVDGLTSALRVAGLSDSDADHGHPAGQCQQRGSTIESEGTSLPIRVPGAHLHPQLRRPPVWAGLSDRAGSQA